MGSVIMAMRSFDQITQTRFKKYDVVINDFDDEVYIVVDYYMHLKTFVGLLVHRVFDNKEYVMSVVGLALIHRIDDVQDR